MGYPPGIPGARPLQISPPSSLVHSLRHRGRITGPATFAPLYGGRTNQVWRILGQKEDLVLKLYRATQSNPLFRNDPAREIQCLQALADTGFVPNLRDSGQFEQAYWVLYDHAPGATWRENPSLAANVLRHLHTTAVTLNAPKGCNGSVEIADHAETILGQCTSEDRARLIALRPSNAVPPSPEVRLIHGDPVAGNILCQGDAAILIDWQCPLLGDPCEDLALFLSPAMQFLYRGQTLTTDEIEHFITAYGCPDTSDRLRQLLPWYHWRMSAYCLWRAENGTDDYARAMELELESLVTM
ncbi:aminoglycoside phosphotransferase family protein [Phaeobacter sp. NW0010-22]|uniref:phosphotransferase family protein n=1 Tax=Phaeobacter sp. NW0010-22 TaxID=3135907 RepID=UPI003342648C